MNDEDNSPEDARGDGYRRDVTTTFVPVSATVSSSGLFTLYRNVSDRSVNNVRVGLTVYRPNHLQRV